jgi:hypothetical protein
MLHLQSDDAGEALLQEPTRKRMVFTEAAGTVNATCRAATSTGRARRATATDTSGEGAAEVGRRKRTTGMGGNSRSITA